MYTDADVQERHPKGNLAPVIAFPGDEATNSVVKAYLLDVLTRTGWGLAVESAQEVRATINSFIGNGWALRNRYTHNKLHNICPSQIAAMEDGVAVTRAVSASVRSNIYKCITHEMERYFELEHKIQIAADGEHTLVSALKASGTDIQERHDSTAEPNGFELPKIRKRPQSRTPLPDEWMSESLRARTKYVDWIPTSALLILTRHRSRLSQYSDNEPPPMPEPMPMHMPMPTRASQPVYIDKTSAYPMPVNIVDQAEVTKSTLGFSKARHDSPSQRECQLDDMASNVGMSNHKHIIPSQVIPGSLLPQPVTSSNMGYVACAGFTSNTALEIEHFVSDTGDVHSGIAVISDALSEVDVDDFANEHAAATSHATPLSADRHGDTANVAMFDAHLDNTSHDNNVTETFQHQPTPIHPDDDKNTDDSTPQRPTKASTAPPRTQDPIPYARDNWNRELGSVPGPLPMPKLPPSPPLAYKVVPDDLDMTAPGVPITGPDAIGNISKVNDIPVGSTTRRIDEQEVEEARTRVEEALHVRQQAALGDREGRLRRWTRRVWGKFKMRKHRRPVVAEGTEGA